MNKVLYTSSLLLLGGTLALAQTSSAGTSGTVNKQSNSPNQNQTMTGTTGSTAGDRSGTGVSDNSDRMGGNDTNASTAAQDSTSTTTTTTTTSKKHTKKHSKSSKKHHKKAAASSATGTDTTGGAEGSTGSQNPK